MLDANHSSNINQNLQNILSSVEESLLPNQTDQMNNLGNLFGNEDELEVLTNLLQLIMQLIHSLGLDDDNPSSEEGGELEEILKRNIFMGILNDSTFDMNSSAYPSFGYDEEEDDSSASDIASA